MCFCQACRATTVTQPRESNHDVNRDSVCVLPGMPPGEYYVRGGSQKWMESLSAGYKQGVLCVWVGTQTVVSRDWEQEHRPQLEHQQSRGEEGGFLALQLCSGMVWAVCRVATGTGAAGCCEVSRCQVPERARSDFCCVWKSFRCSDPQVWPPMRNGLQGFQDRDSSKTARAPLPPIGHAVLDRLDRPA